MLQLLLESLEWIVEDEFFHQLISLKPDQNIMEAHSVLIIFGEKLRLHIWEIDPHPFAGEAWACPEEILSEGLSLPEDLRNFCDPEPIFFLTPGYSLIAFDDWSCGVIGCEIQMIRPQSEESEKSREASHLKEVGIPDSDSRAEAEESSESHNIICGMRLQSPSLPRMIEGIDLGDSAMPFFQLGICLSMSDSPPPEFFSPIQSIQIDRKSPLCVEESDPESLLPICCCGSSQD